MEIPIAKTAYKKPFTVSFHSTLPTLLRKFVNAQPLYIKHLELDIQKIPMAHGCLGIYSDGGVVGAMDDKHYVHPLNSLNQIALAVLGG